MGFPSLSYAVPDPCPWIPALLQSRERHSARILPFPSLSSQQTCSTLQTSAKSAFIFFPLSYALPTIPRSPDRVPLVVSPRGGSCSPAAGKHPLLLHPTTPGASPCRADTWLQSALYSSVSGIKHSCCLYSEQKSAGYDGLSWKLNPSVTVGADSEPRGVTGRGDSGASQGLGGAQRPSARPGARASADG